MYIGKQKIAFFKSLISYSILFFSSTCVFSFIHWLVFKTTNSQLSPERPALLSGGGCWAAPPGLGWWFQKDSRPHSCRRTALFPPSSLLQQILHRGGMNHNRRRKNLENAELCFCKSPPDGKWWSGGARPAEWDCGLLETPVSQWHYCSQEKYCCWVF